MLRLKKFLGIYAVVVYPAILFLSFHVEINKSNRLEAKSVCMEFSNEEIVCGIQLNTSIKIPPIEFFLSSGVFQFLIMRIKTWFIVPVFLVSKNKTWSDLIWKACNWICTKPCYVSLCNNYHPLWYLSPIIITFCHTLYNLLSRFAIPVALYNKLLSHFVITTEWIGNQDPGPIKLDSGSGIQGPKPRFQDLRLRTQNLESKIEESWPGSRFYITHCLDISCPNYFCCIELFTTN